MGPEIKLTLNYQLLTRSNFDMMSTFLVELHLNDALNHPLGRCWREVGFRFVNWPLKVKKEKNKIECIIMIYIYA